MNSSLLSPSSYDYKPLLIQLQCMCFPYGSNGLQDTWSWSWCMCEQCLKKNGVERRLESHKLSCLWHKTVVKTTIHVMPLKILWWDSRSLSRCTHESYPKRGVDFVRLSSPWQTIVATTAVYVVLVRPRDESHDVYQDISISLFQEEFSLERLRFCQSILPSTTILDTTAVHLLSIRAYK